MESRYKTSKVHRANVTKAMKKYRFTAKGKAANARARKKFVDSGYFKVYCKQRREKAKKDGVCTKCFKYKLKSSSMCRKCLLAGRERAKARRGKRLK